MSDNDTSDQESDDVECEWDGCDEVLSTERGMKIHHTKTHGESISGVEVECAWCGEPKRVIESHLEESDNFFCGGDKDCQKLWKSENVVGEDHPLWGRVEVECAWCSEEKQVKPSRVDTYDRFFCGDSDCKSQWMSENKTGENSNSWEGGGVEVECSWCGKTRLEQRSRAKTQDNFFCNDGGGCMSEWLSERNSGSDNYFWNGGKVCVECSNCGKTKRVKPSRIDSRENFFCDSSCWGEWRSENWVGNNAPAWNGGGVTVHCSWCGSEKQVPTYQHDAQEHFFCERGGDCLGSWISENLSGEDHPQWNGGTAKYYGPNWRQQRRRAIERDNEQCVGCGRTREEQYELWDEDLHVHHKRPLATFPFVDNVYHRDWEVANGLSNLMTCCGACHRGLDVISQSMYPADEYPRYIHPTETDAETPAEAVQASLSKFG